MSCDWLERVAVAMDDEWTDEIQQHVDGCPVCAELLADREWLRSVPPLPPLKPIHTPRQRRWLPAAIAAAAALTAVAAGVQWLSRTPVEPITVAVQHPGAPSQLPPPAVLRVRRTQTQGGPRVLAHDPEKLARSLGSMLYPSSAPEGTVTLYTEDPDVVIVLVPESKGIADD
ncbi:MAG TPA: hypothetical protein VES20_09235 [Bryobacteraceae bacterium]|nr:hypothetical protein [Bryobacteraceae bacterium]